MGVIGTFAGLAGYDPDADSAGQSLMLGAINAATSPVEGPLMREAAYQANYVSQNLVPDPQTTIGLYYAGRISQDQLMTLLAYQGIDYDPATYDPGSFNGKDTVKTAWKNAIDLAAPRFGIEQTRQMYRQEILTATEAIDTFTRHGFTRTKDITDFLGQPELMGVPTLLAMLRLNIITTNEFKRYVKWLGISDYWVGLLEDSMNTPPAVSDAVSAYLRGIIDEPKLNKYLRWNGITKPDEQDVVKKLARQIPSAQDLILFSVREAWNESVVQTYGYDDEFPEPFKYWMKSQGFDWNEDIPVAGGPPIRGVNWPNLYWRSHWRPISPGQAYTMLHRLRGDPNNPASWRIPGVRPFTMDDVRSILKIQDTPPAFRDRLAAVSYLPLRLVDIRSALSREVEIDAAGNKAGRDWAIEQFQDRGHNLATAIVQANMAVAIGAEKKERKTKLRGERLNEKWIAAIQDNYRDGILTRPNAEFALLTKDVPQEQANDMLDFVDMQIQANMFREVVRQIKKDYLSGRIDKPDMINRLTATGMTQEAKDKYVFAWDRIKDEGHVFATAAKAIEFYKRGFLTYDQTVRRLKGLGLWAPDAIMLIEAANQDMTKLFAKAEETEGKKVAAKAKELQRLAELSASFERKMRLELKSITPIATILKWLRNGTVTPEWAEHRLRAIGFPDDVILNYLEDALPEGEFNAVQKDENKEEGATEENGKRAATV